MLKKIIISLKKDGLLIITSVAKYPYRYIKNKIYDKLPLKKRFEEKYKKKLWFYGESLSGPGSEIGSTEAVRKWLISNIPKLKVKTFVDAACGDLNWMKLVLTEIDTNYIGLDIVDSLISKNKLQYGSPKVDFRQADICVDILPSCDIIMVRDCLFHLSYKDINEFLINLAKTDYKYLLTTSHKHEKEFKNSDIISGQFRVIDLFAEPFNFDSDLVSDRFDEDLIDTPIKREMILVEKKFVPTSL